MNAIVTFYFCRVKILAMLSSLVFRCSRCTNYDSALESPGVGNEKGASVLATYNNVDSEWLLIILSLCPITAYDSCAVCHSV